MEVQSFANYMHPDTHMHAHTCSSGLENADHWMYLWDPFQGAMCELSGMHVFWGCLDFKDRVSLQMQIKSLCWPGRLGPEGCALQNLSLGQAVWH